MRGALGLALSAVLILFGGVAIVRGVLQRELAWLADSTLSSDAAAEEYRLAQANPRDARAYADRRAAQRQQVELEQRAGARQVILGASALGVGGVLGGWLFARRRRRAPEVPGEPAGQPGTG